VNWRDHLVATLRRLQPASVCTLDASAHRLAGPLFQPGQLRAYADPRVERCSLALGVDVLNGLEPRQGFELLARVRTYAAPGILIAAQPRCGLSADEFRALGFVASSYDADEDVTVYHYDIATYKPVPDWLNPKYWAHPERWEP